MTQKQAYRLGVESGLEAGLLGDFARADLADFDSFAVACSEVCDNKRQFAGHPGYDFNREGERADGLWNAFEEGEAAGVRKAWRQQNKKGGRP